VAGVLNRIEIWDGAQWADERTAAEAQSAELAEHLSELGL
jgi:DNA-binding transcriptional regulator/RsmH inhibitor MraZ